MSVPNVVMKIYYYKPENKFEKLKKKREYYSSNKSNGDDYMKYIDKGSKEGQVYDYIEYTGNSEKSSGVFGRNGLLGDQEKKEIRKMLRKTKSVIWDVVISFTEEYGKEKMKSYIDAMELVKKHLPKLMKNNWINYDNIIWFAGLHENTDNRHIHLSFFEKEPLHNRQNKEGLHYHFGQLRKSSINRMKVEIEDDLNRSNYYFESYRRNLMFEANNILSDDILLDKKIKEKILNLYSKLPKGRTSFNSLNMIEFRPMIKEIESLLIKKSPLLNKELQNIKKDLFLRDEEIKRICENQNINPAEFLLKDKFVSDLHRRLGNKIIKYTKEIGYKNKILENKRFAKIIEKNKRKQLLMQTISLSRNVDYEAIEVFEEYRRKMLEIELEKLKQEGVIEESNE